MGHEQHTHTPGDMRPEEAVALLRYMEQHNAHHAEELLETAGALPETAAALIRDAADLLNRSTEKIRQALRETEA